MVHLGTKEKFLGVNMDTEKYRKNLQGEVVGPDEKFLKRDQVMEMCSISHSHIYYLMNKGMFPKSQRIANCSVVWLESDINLWRSMNTKHFFAEYGEQIKAQKLGEGAAA
ncbi:transcriptional regulator [Pseudoalteromonas sp. S558]|nr:transcriptional regulator [Pseudoalteromonas sp. S558]